MCLRETKQLCIICRNDENIGKNGCEGCNGSGFQIVTEKKHKVMDGGPDEWIELKSRSPSSF